MIILKAGKQQKKGGAKEKPLLRLSVVATRETAVPVSLMKQ